MARIVPSGLIADIRGKIGGVVFQKSQSGLIVRSNTSPVNKNSISQNIVKAATFKAQQAWVAATPAQRSLWDAMSIMIKKQQKNNANRFLDAKQYFIKANIYRYLYGFDTLVLTEFHTGSIDPISIIVSLSGGNVTVSTNRVMVPAVEFIIFFITYRVNATLNQPQGNLRLLVFQTLAISDFNVESEYLIRFGGGLSVGDTIFFKYSLGHLQTGNIFPFITERVVV